MEVTLNLPALLDESMAFIKQIGVNYVQVSPPFWDSNLAKLFKRMFRRPLKEFGLPALT